MRPEGACHQRRRVPPRELSIDLVADERLADASLKGTSMLRDDSNNGPVGGLDIAMCSASRLLKIYSSEKRFGVQCWLDKELTSEHQMYHFLMHEDDADTR